MFQSTNESLNSCLFCAAATLKFTRPSGRTDFRSLETSSSAHGSRNSVKPLCFLKAPKQARSWPVLKWPSNTVKDQCFRYWCGRLTSKHTVSHRVYCRIRKQTPKKKNGWMSLWTSTWPYRNHMRFTEVFLVSLLSLAISHASYYIISYLTGISHQTHLHLIPSMPIKVFRKRSTGSSLGWYPLSREYRWKLCLLNGPFARQQNSFEQHPACHVRYKLAHKEF